MIESPATKATGLNEVAAFFDGFAAGEPRWRRRNSTYHRLVESIHRFLVPRGQRVLEIGSGSGDLLAALEPSRGLGIDVSRGMVELARHRHPGLEFEQAAGETFRTAEEFDAVLLSDLVPYAEDLIEIFKNVRALTHPRSRVVVHSYSQLWRPVIRVAELLRLKARKPIRNWISPHDVEAMLELAGFEVITVSRRILFPVRIPLLSVLLNGLVANVWPFQHLCLTYWVVARPRPPDDELSYSVSVVIPCRNEAGTIAEIVARVPELGSSTELVFVEGGSTDATRAEIERQIELHPEREISLHLQEGRGKGDAVRLGFSRARNELLVILDGDLSVDPDELQKFYDAIATGRADLANGSRLVYGMERGAMQFLNVAGNKVFSVLLRSLIGQPIKDTLCGTKALLKRDYVLIAQRGSWGDDLDPFGDFELVLGSVEAGSLKVLDVPVRYHARRYGSTNISRFRHGWLLLRMTVLGFYKLKVTPVKL